MIGMGAGGCPFEFNSDPATFRVGDWVSYRVTGSLEGFPFAGVLAEVHDDHVVITADAENKTDLMRATRESRPVVDETELA